MLLMKFMVRAEIRPTPLLYFKGGHAESVNRDAGARWTGQPQPCVA
jgi:hypothetical protein